MVIYIIASLGQYNEFECKLRPLLQIKHDSLRSYIMHCKLATLILMVVLLTMLLVINVHGQTLVKGKGNGNIRVTKTCGAGRKKPVDSSEELAAKKKKKEKEKLKELSKKKQDTKDNVAKSLKDEL